VLAEQLKRVLIGFAILHEYRSLAYLATEIDIFLLDDEEHSRIIVDSAKLS